MKKMLLAVALVAALLSLSAVAQNAKVSKAAIGPSAALNSNPSNPSCGSPCLFYGGDWVSSASNWVALGNADEYDAGTIYNYSQWIGFTVPAGETWSVIQLFTNNIMYNYSTGTNHFKLDPKEASWGIATGVTSSGIGSVVASGLSPAKLVSTGRSYSDVYFEYSTVVKTGTVSLGAGTYFLAVAPECTDASCTEFAYNTDSTAHTNAQGVEPKCVGVQAAGASTGQPAFVDDCTYYHENYGYATSGLAFWSAGVQGHK